MTKIATLVAVLGFTLSAALAGDEPRRLTYEQAQGAFAALQALDGHPPRGVKDGQQERVVVDPYDLAPGLRLVIAQDLLKAKNAVSTLQVAFTGVQKQFLDPKTQKVPDEQLVEFNVAVRKLQQELAEESFIPIRYEELKPATNNFPPSVLAGLMPLLIIEEKK